jgi:putative oxidoreductase
MINASRFVNGTRLHALPIEKAAILFTRIALGAAFLSGIASRFGWWGPGVGYGSFQNFVTYTAEVNSFMPANTIVFLAWSATIAECVLGVALLVGLFRPWTAIASTTLLILFGSAMAVSFGIKSPLDYSVFSAAGAALLLAIFDHPRQEGGQE